MAQSLPMPERCALYGIYFDTDKDNSSPRFPAHAPGDHQAAEVDAGLNVHIVGHTDNQGKADYNLDLSRRRALSVVRELTTKYGIPAGSLDSFGCGLLPQSYLMTLRRAGPKNRRVELVKGSCPLGVRLHRIFELRIPVPRPCGVSPGCARWDSSGQPRSLISRDIQGCAV